MVELGVDVITGAATYRLSHLPDDLPGIPPKAATVTDDNGKEVKRYPRHRMMTPCDKLKSLPDAERFLKPGLTFAELDKIAYNITDNEAARRMNEARNLLFTNINEQENHAVKRKAR